MHLDLAPVTPFFPCREEEAAVVESAPCPWNTSVVSGCLWEPPGSREQEGLREEEAPGNGRGHYSLPSRGKDRAA